MSGDGAGPVPSEAGPASASERIEVVDVLRGFALCGILALNILAFKAPGSIPSFGVADAWIDRLASSAVVLFAQSKFFTLFSFLFGMGFSMQLLRAERRGVPFAPLFLRRLLVLGVIGAAHHTLLWDGDILLRYALIGLLLLAVRSMPTGMLLRWAVGLLAIPLAVYLLAFAGLAVARVIPAFADDVADLDRQVAVETAEEVRSFTAAVVGSSYKAAVVARVQELDLASSLVPGMTILSMFLLGLAAGRVDLAGSLAEHRDLLRRVRTWGFVVGLPIAALVAVGINRLATVHALMAILFNVALAGPVLAMAYAASVGLLWQRPGWRRLLRPLAAFGRLALTNYLGQSLVSTFLFYGWGLGLARRIPPAQALAIAAGILAVQILISNWWVRRLRFGPAEWIWRTLTYGRPQPLRLAP